MGPRDTDCGGAYGGRIEVQSEVGKGTVFTIWLPINADAAAGNAPGAPAVPTVQ